MLSNQEVVDFVTQRLGQGMEPEDICEQLMTRSPLAGSLGALCRDDHRDHVHHDPGVQVPVPRLPDGRPWL